MFWQCELRSAPMWSIPLNLSLLFYWQVEENGNSSRAGQCFLSLWLPSDSLTSHSALVHVWLCCLLWSLQVAVVLLWSRWTPSLSRVFENMGRPTKLGCVQVDTLLTLKFQIHVHIHWLNSTFDGWKPWLSTIYLSLFEVITQWSSGGCSKFNLT